MTNKLPPFRFISDNETFRWLAVELSQEPLLAIDTESNSMHAYHPQVCLVQLSTRDQDFIIDPFAIDDMSPLGVLLASPEIEIVLHAAEYDLMTLKRDYGFTITNLFDTMIAARLAKYESFGLAAMLKRYFGAEPDKSHQLDDWGKRPLPQDSLHYAQMDTHFLPRLRDHLQDELLDLGRWAEAQELFLEAQDVPEMDNSFDADGYWNLARPNELTELEIKVLRELYLLREAMGDEQNRPVFKVLSNKTLVRIAKEQPKNLKQLSKIRGVPGRQVRQYGQDILDAIRRGHAAPEPPPPPAHDPPPPQIADRFVVLQQWRKHKGKERGVGSDIVLSKSTLWELAWQLPQTLEDLAQVDGIGPQRLQLYGPELVNILADLR